MRLSDQRFGKKSIHNFLPESSQTSRWALSTWCNNELSTSNFGRQLKFRHFPIFAELSHHRSLPSLFFFSNSRGLARTLPTPFSPRSRARKTWPPSCLVSAPWSTSAGLRSTTWGPALIACDWRSCSPAVDRTSYSPRCRVTPGTSLQELTRCEAGIKGSSRASVLRAHVPEPSSTVRFSRFHRVTSEASRAFHAVVIKENCNLWSNKYM